MREAFERAEAHLQWLKESAFDEQDLARIVGYERCLRAWQAATAEADAKYLPVVEKLVEALESAKINLNDFRGCIYDRDDDDIKTQEKIAEALALAEPLLEKKEEV